MADYKELLRRAISALPENNGSARRAVYEKARSALVGQLRAITPPLPARDITQHRLQLEDCIRQVEQEASESVISFGRDLPAAPRPPQAAARPDTPLPAASAPKAEAVPEQETAFAASANAAPVPQPSEAAKDMVAEPAPEEPAAEPKADTDLAADVAPVPAKPAGDVTIEEIIAQAAAATGSSVQRVADPLPGDKAASSVVTASFGSAGAAANGPSEASRSDSSKSEAPARSDTPSGNPPLVPRREPTPMIANGPSGSARAVGRHEPSMGGAQAVRSVPVAGMVAAQVEPALSSVREVDLELADPDMSEAQGAIERAIETLDREARGEPSTHLYDKAPGEAELAALGAKTIVPDPQSGDNSGFVDTAETAPRSGSGVTIFLIVFAILLAGAGGAGFWAWREGYVDLDQMFGQAQPVAADSTDIVGPSTPTLDPVQSNDVATGPGNTSTAVPAEPTTTLEGLQTEDRLEPTPGAVVPNGTETALPSLNGESKGEERLTGESTELAAADDLAASVDPAVLAGSQSLLLEASQDGRTGAVPFSGTVEWSEGADELGLPTLIGRANIPARNLSVSVTIRKNSDPSLPASHLMEVDFQINDTFIGGTIANLPGVLLKDEELVPGTPLVGASARVVGNSFLFALSASEADSQTNVDLLENRKWVDLAVVYGTGRNAILTLEKDETAQALFEKVFGVWAS